MSQCAIIGKIPYKNIIAKENKFEFSPVHTDDIATVIGQALETSRPGRFSVNGNESMTLRQIMDILEVAAFKEPGITIGPMIQPLDLVWDFFAGTSSDLNMSRIVEFLEENQDLHADQHANSWGFTATTSFADHYENL